MATFIQRVLLAAGGLSSIQKLIIKLVTEEHVSASYQIVFSRGLIQLTIASFFIYREPPPRAPIFGPTRRVQIIMLARSVMGFLGIGFAFQAVEKLPVGMAFILVVPLILHFISLASCPQEMPRF